MSGIKLAAKEDRAVLGIGLVLLAYLMFSSVDTSVKWLGQFGYAAMQLAFMRYFAHFLIATGRVVRGGFTLQNFQSPHLGLVILRGLFILGSTAFNFIALKYIPLTLTSTILFSAPIIVCLLSGTLLGEKVGIWRWSAILIGFIGIMIAIRPFDENFHWAAILSLLGATCFSFYLLLTRHLAGKVSSDMLQFYSGAVGCFALLPIAIIQWQAPDLILHWVMLIGLGVLAWIGHEILTRAYRFADATVLTPYSYSFMLYLTVWSILLFDQYPDRLMLGGAALVVVSGLVIWLRERTRNRSLVTVSE